MRYIVTWHASSFLFFIFCGHHVWKPLSSTPSPFPDRWPRSKQPQLRSISIFDFAFRDWWFRKEEKGRERGDASRGCVHDYRFVRFVDHWMSSQYWIKTYMDMQWKPNPALSHLFSWPWNYLFSLHLPWFRFMTVQLSSIIDSGHCVIYPEPVSPSRGI